jgi:(p)ppGpp synthase/HD superfamily hydrolase
VPDVTFTVANAAALAFHMHAGKVDKLGRDYVNYHLVPVAAEVGGVMLERGTPAEDVDHVFIVAWLHDILEDTEMTFEELQAIAGERVAIDVHILTRDKGETYAEYIESILPWHIPRMVKMADNTVNRQGCPSESLYRRYVAAGERLFMDG